MAESKSDSEPTRSPPPEKPEAFGRGEHPEANKEQKDDGSKKQEGGDEGKDAKAEPKKPPSKPFWKRPILLTSIILFAVAAIVVGVLISVHLNNFESTDDAFIDGRIARISSRVAGKVLELNVTDNQLVEADTQLIKIDPAPFQVKVDQTLAAEQQSVAQEHQAEANRDVAVASAEQADADVIVAKANALNAEKDFDRFQKLPPEARSQQQVDAAVANHNSTEAQVTAAQKKANAMHAQAMAAEKTIEAAKASTRSLMAQTEQARLDLSYTVVVAGHRGRVTRRTVEVGNYVSIGQEILTVVPTDVPDDIWITANFKETQLVHMQKGQKATISIDAYPDEKLTGHVDSMQNGSGAVFSLLPSENATGNYVKVVQRVPVKIVIDSKPTHLLSPGLSVDPQVDVRSYDGNGNLNDTASNSRQ